MKNLLLTTIVIISLVPFARAQKARFGVTAGATLSSYRTDVDEKTASSNMLVGFSAGVTADLPLSKDFSFQPALQFLQKGGSESNMGYTLNTRLYYLEMPLNFVYKAPGKEGHFLIGLGPSLGMGLFGNASISGGGQSSSTTIHFGKDGDFKSFDFGGNILTGYEWKSGFAVMANYNVGFSNIFDDDQSSFKNNYFGLRFSYFFGSRK